jgi:hypothetical protein
MKLWNLLAVAGLTAGIANAGVIILDDFDADPNDDAGGPRTISSMVLANPFSQPFNAAVDTGVNLPSGDTGAFVFNAGIGVNAKSTIRWDNNGAGLNLDLVALGVTALELDFEMVDLPFTISFFSDSGNGGTATFSSGVIASLTPQTVSIGIGSLILAGGFDATDVDAVEITFNSGANSTASLDFILTEFRAVPTPGSLALLGLGGLAVARRRR